MILEESSLAVCRLIIDLLLLIGLNLSLLKCQNKSLFRKSLSSVISSTFSDFEKVNLFVLIILKANSKLYKKLPL